VKRVGAAPEMRGGTQRRHPMRGLVDGQIIGDVTTFALAVLWNRACEADEPCVAC
jgi:hypothetical protein